MNGLQAVDKNKSIQNKVDVWLGGGGGVVSNYNSFLFVSKGTRRRSDDLGI